VLINGPAKPRSAGIGKIDSPFGRFGLHSGSNFFQSGMVSIDAMAN
jgi:hypothetical protein